MNKWSYFTPAVKQIIRKRYTVISSAESTSKCKITKGV